MVSLLWEGINSSTDTSGSGGGSDTQRLLDRTIIALSAALSSFACPGIPDISIAGGAVVVVIKVVIVLSPSAAAQDESTEAIQERVNEALYSNLLS